MTPQCFQGRITTAVLFILLPAVSAQAVTLSLDEALQLAERNAPSLQARLEQASAARSSVIPAGELPDPRLNLGVQNLPIEGADRWSMNRDFMTMQVVGLSQDVPNREKRKARVETAQATVERADAEAVFERLKIRAATAQAWVTAYTVQRKLEHFDAFYKENQLLWLLPGKLTALLADADLQSRTLRLRIELPNPDGRLRPGMTAQVSVRPNANRMKVLVHDGVGVWLAARRLNQGKFHWPGIRHGCEVELDSEQLQALVLGLPWQRVCSSSFRACSGTISGMTSSPNLDHMTPEQLRALAAQASQLQSQVEAMSRKIQNDEILIEQFKFEIALLKRHKFAKRSEQISQAQGSLLDDLLDTDLEAIEAELKQLLPASSQVEPRQSPKRAPLPPQFPRTVIRHEPENTQCA